MQVKLQEGKKEAGICAACTDKRKGDFIKLMTILDMARLKLEIFPFSLPLSLFAFHLLTRVSFCRSRFISFFSPSSSTSSRLRAILAEWSRVASRGLETRSTEIHLRPRGHEINSACESKERKVRPANKRERERERESVTSCRKLNERT